MSLTLPPRPSQSRPPDRRGGPPWHRRHTSLLTERCASYQPTQLVHAVQHKPILSASFRSKQLHHSAHLASLQDGQRHNCTQAGPQCGNNSRCVLVGEEVLEPHRLSPCPDAAGHTLTFFELCSPSRLLEADWIDLLRVPHPLEAQHLASAVDQPERAQAPTHLPADRLQDTGRRCLQGASFLNCLGHR